MDYRLIIGGHTMPWPVNEIKPEIVIERLTKAFRSGDPVHMEIAGGEILWTPGVPVIFEPIDPEGEI